VTLRHENCGSCKALNTLAGGLYHVQVVCRAETCYQLRHTFKSWAEFFALNVEHRYRISAGVHGFGATVYVEGLV
jgi:hypothetical protein